nr:glycosyl hydrolase [Massilia sp. JS1662]
MQKLRMLLLVSSTFWAGQAATASPASQQSLLANFQNPPEASKVQVWWHWMDGNVDLEGAKLDLQWMKAVGVGGVHIFSGGGLGGGLSGPVIEHPKPYMSNEWKGVFREATRIAKSDGMEVTIAGSPGWSQTGGPWVQEADAMKKYVWSTTQIVDGASFDGRLTSPPTAAGQFAGVSAKNTKGKAVAPYYRDAHIVAFPTPPAERKIARTYTTVSGDVSLAPIENGYLDGTVAIPTSSGTNSAFLQTTFAEPVTLSALTLGVDARTNFDVQVLDNEQFRTILHVDADPIEHPSPQQTYRFTPSTGTVFRVIFTAAGPLMTYTGLPPGANLVPRPRKAFTLSRFSFETGGRVNRFEAKAGFQSTMDFLSNATPPVSSDAAVIGSRVIDLTSKMNSNGRLDWTPPPGNWTILRFGYTLTGQKNGPAEESATGLEVDKLDGAAVRRYIEQYLSMYADALGERLGKNTVGSLLTDSWEAGVQNWTPAMLDEFKARRAYDPVPYLPVLAGYVVDDAATSDKFLWDFRQTLKDLLVDNHYAVLAEALHAHGMTYYTEAQGDAPRGIGDGMAMKSRADIPTAEYWYRPFWTDAGQPPLKADLKEAASVGHLYGKPIVAAESLTVAAGSDPWAFSPAMLKPVADEIFANGINRILMHDSHHQPFVDKKPGLAMGLFGQFFNRNDTWANYAAPWVSYLSRTSEMLQQGHYVADVAYFYGEQMSLAESFAHKFNTDVPRGYQYDYVNPEALLKLMEVKHGRLTTQSGMNYRVLYMPADVTRMTLPVLNKMRDLVSAGATLVGPKPAGGLGIQSPDEEVQRLADQLWGPDPQPGRAHRYGKGRVYARTSLDEVLKAEKIPQDIAIDGENSPNSVLTLHRRTADSEIYFITNQSEQPQSLQLRFPLKDKVPSVWHAENAAVEKLSYRRVPGGTVVPLSLTPHQAVFIVFSGNSAHSSFQTSVTKPAVLSVIQGPWEVAFEQGMGAPAKTTFDSLISWPDSTDAGIKYYSGTATYRKHLVAQENWFKPRHRTLLDLGEVKEIAVVTVNGKTLGTVWHPPYVVDLTDVLRPGENELEIKVVNLWPNRLIGDRQPNATKYTYAPRTFYTASSPLLRSGLLGPVRIIAQ